MLELTREQIVEWNASREVRSLRTRDIKGLKVPWVGRDVVFTCSNGWTIEKLVVEDWPIEGFFMGHCLAVPKYVEQYKKYERERFHSLRDATGVPHCTIYASRDATGRTDCAPKAEYLDLVKEWHPEIHGTNKKLDTDTAYHQDGQLNDRDYRDTLVAYQDAAWRAKRA